MRDALLGLRVLVGKGGGLVYGVARVRYNEGHVHAGNYEIETADGTSFLAPVGDCLPGKNWDVTPEEGRFTGAEFFRPNFLDGATGQDRGLFTRDHGVIVPSDMDRLRSLIATVEAGQKVGFYGHGCNEFRGQLVIDSIDDQGIRMKGGKGPHPVYSAWPTSGQAEISAQYAYEFLVEGGMLHTVCVPPARYGSHARKAVTLTFEGKGRG